MSRLLFITNGRGEDQVAGEIIKHLPAECSATVLSLVSEKLPSGGFALRNWRFLLADLSAGLIGQTYQNIQVLREARNHFDRVVAIGDIVPLLGALFARLPLIFVGVNKSAYYQSFGYGYTPWELWLLRKYAKKVFVRDQLTADTYGFSYVGNPLLDAVAGFASSVTKQEIGDRRQVTIGFLPGTRANARKNLEDFAKVAEQVKRQKPLPVEVNFIVAAKEENVPAVLTKVSFDDLLARSSLVVGLSGTGNEQAAGCGLPLVSFYGRGSQYNARFAEAQKELLGEALILVRSRFPALIAAAIWQVLGDPDKIKQMGEIGRQRMGQGGAAVRIAAYLNDKK
jgi:hypothetical protein